MLTKTIAFFTLASLASAASVPEMAKRANDLTYTITIPDSTTLTTATADQGEPETRDGPADVQQYYSEDELSTLKAEDKPWDPVFREWKWDLYEPGTKNLVWQADCRSFASGYYTGNAAWKLEVSKESVQAVPVGTVPDKVDGYLSCYEATCHLDNEDACKAVLPKPLLKSADPPV